MDGSGVGATRVAPLDGERLRGALVGPRGPWTDIRVSAETGSTNSDVLRLAQMGAPAGLVIATERQNSGRGRQGRAWGSIPYAALTFSVLLRPAGVPPALRGWVPLLAGLAASTAVRSRTAVDASLKWPNDVMVGDRKLAGILAEQTGDAIVVGIGLNVLGQAKDLPVPTATSLEREGVTADRTDLLIAILRELAGQYQRWSGTAHGDPETSGLRSAYLTQCGTIGRQVRVMLPGDAALTGIAADIDGTGRLIVASGGSEPVAVSAGDVIHVR
jgi:BirA family biotin operon repressor/biotin-[acetyl-CoA-carboxylase] ligase